MMKTYSLIFAKGRRARIWLDGLPPTEIHGRSELQLEAIASSVGSPGRKVALEVAIPTGGRLLYGLLGAEFVPTAGSVLTVVVPMSNDGGPQFHDALCEPIEDATVGLPMQYAEAVLAALAEDTQNKLLPPGVLRFGTGAHSLAGSAPFVFCHLALLVKQIIFEPDCGLDEVLLSTKFEQVSEQIATRRGSPC